MDFGHFLVVFAELRWRSRVVVGLSRFDFVFFCANYHGMLFRHVFRLLLLQRHVARIMRKGDELEVYLWYFAMVGFDVRGGAIFGRAVTFASVVALNFLYGHAHEGQ